MKTEYWKTALVLTTLVIALLTSSHTTMADQKGVSPEFLNHTSPSVVTTWAKTYGGTSSELASSLALTSDGGYIVVGRTGSFGAGSNDVWALKLDGAGNIAWQKTYGGAGSDSAQSVAQTSDGGYIIAGTTNSFGAGLRDFWVLKLDGSGNVMWQKTYGGTGDDTFPQIVPTNDGGYIVAGWTASFGAGLRDFWVLKLDGSGNVTWQKTYGGTGYDSVFSIANTNDGGYILAGDTFSFGASGGAAWVLKLDALGNVTWQKGYGGTGEVASSIVPTSDGGYIMAGSTSLGAGLGDAWVVKLDGSGNITWQETYGGTGFDTAESIAPTSDGGYVMAAYTESFGTRSGDIWVLKLGGTGNVTWQKTYGTTNGYDFPNNPIIPTSDGGYVLARSTKVFGAGNYDVLVLKMDGNGNIVNMCPPPINTFVTGTNSSVGVLSTTATVATTAVAPNTTNTSVAPSSATVQQISACTNSLFLPLILR